MEPFLICMLEPSEELVTILRKHGFEVKVFKDTAPMAGKILPDRSGAIILKIWPKAPLRDGRWLMKLRIMLKSQQRDKPIVYVKNCLDPRSPMSELKIGPYTISWMESYEERSLDCLYQNIHKLLDELGNPIHYILSKVSEMFRLIDELLPRE